MSRRRDIEAGLRSLHGISEILNAMKQMARVEVHRLGPFLAAQKRVVEGIEAAGADFAHFHSELFPADDSSEQACVLLGSERGFCGDFNDSLLRALSGYGGKRFTRIVAIGSKLASKLPVELAAARLDGASVVEEVEGVLVNLMNTLVASDSRVSHRPLRVTVFHHQTERNAVQISVLYPFRRTGASPSHLPAPPRLYLDPVTFATGLVEQYLFAWLHELIYGSLMVENQARIERMDSALQRLDKRSSDLLRRRNMLRQEEITEEIEVIMLTGPTLGRT